MFHFLSGTPAGTTVVFFPNIVFSEEENNRYFPLMEPDSTWKSPRDPFGTFGGSTGMAFSLASFRYDNGSGSPRCAPSVGVTFTGAHTGTRWCVVRAQIPEQSCINAEPPRPGTWKLYKRPVLRDFPDERLDSSASEARSWLVNFVGKSWLWDGKNDHLANFLFAWTSSTYSASWKY